MVRQISHALGGRGIHIVDMHTEILSKKSQDEHDFHLRGLLVVPEAVSDTQLRELVESIATELNADAALDASSGNTAA